MRRCGTLLLSVLFLVVFCGTARSMDAQALYQKLKGSLLIIYMKTGYTYGDDNDWGFAGTGFAIGDGTLAVTNQHVVIDKGTFISAKPLDAARMVDVEVLRISRDSDLAVIKLPWALPPLELSPDEIKVGQEVAALGNPQGFMGTLSTGVVSGMRSFPKWRVKELVQTTVPASPGSSGSPLVDCRGRVVGVISSGFFKEQNLNFAVPVSKLRELLGRDLLPEAGEQRAPSGPAGGLDVQKAPDGSITIIQKKKR